MRPNPLLFVRRTTTLAGVFCRCAHDPSGSVPCGASSSPSLGRSFESSSKFKDLDERSKDIPREGFELAPHGTLPDGSCAGCEKRQNTTLKKCQQSEEREQLISHEDIFLRPSGSLVNERKQFELTCDRVLSSFINFQAFFVDFR